MELLEIKKPPGRWHRNRRSLSLLVGGYLYLVLLDFESERRFGDVQRRGRSLLDPVVFDERLHYILLLPRRHFLVERALRVLRALVLGEDPGRVDVADLEVRARGRPRRG